MIAHENKTIYHYLIVIGSMVALLTLWNFPLFPIELEARSVKKLYVARNGSDDWSGDLPEPNAAGTDGPLLTLVKAKEKVRQLKQRVEGEIRVYIREGVYELEDTLVFTSDDSGTERQPISYVAFPGEQPVISGGKVIGGAWHEGQQGIYYTELPEAAGGAWTFRSLFVDGARAVHARYPNKNDGEDYLFAYPNKKTLLAGLAQQGDFVNYEFTVAEEGEYTVWLGYATMLADNERYLELHVDTIKQELGSMPESGTYRKVLYRPASRLTLAAGAHSLRLSNTSAEGEHRVHLDAIVLTTNGQMEPQGEQWPALTAGEHRIVIEAEDESMLTDSQSSSLPFTTFTVQPLDADARTIMVEPGQFKASWQDDPAAYVHMAVGKQYYSSYVHIGSVDEAIGVMKVEGTEAQDTILPGGYFYVAGLLEELDEDGEWYLDGRIGRLYYKPVGGKHPGLSHFAAPRLDRLIEFAGNSAAGERVEWITFSGLRFEHSADRREQTSLRTPTDGAIRLVDAHRIVIEKSHFTNIDGFAVWLHLDSRYNRIRGNVMEYMGSGGILFTSAKLGYGNQQGDVLDSRPEVQQSAPLRNEVSRNVIRYGNQVRHTGAAILLDSRPESTALEPGNVIAFNDISEMRRQGIFGFRNQGGHVIAYNRFTNMMLTTSDAGAVNFATINTLQAPTIIHNNIIDGAVGRFREGSGEIRTFGYGLYTDWESSHYHIRNNLVRGTGEGSLLNKGQFITVINNIFLDDKDHLLNYIDEGRLFIQNHVFHNIVAQLEQPGNSWRFPDGTARRLRENGRFMLYSDRNLYWNAGEALRLRPLDGFQEWQQFGQDEHSIFADPLFVDSQRSDFRLKPGATVQQIGFREWEFNNVGVAAHSEEQLTLETLESLTPLVVRASSKLEGSAASFVPDIAESGLYMVYAERVSHTEPLPDVPITFAHAHGTSNSLYSDWLVPGSVTNANFPIYLGTYQLESHGGHRVKFVNPGLAMPQFPRALVFVRYPVLNEPVRHLREVQLAVAQIKMTTGTEQRLTLFGAMNDYTAAELRQSSVRYVSDNERLVQVGKEGTVKALAPGEVLVRAEVTLDGVTVVSSALRISVE